MPSFKSTSVQTNLLEFSKQSAILNLLESGVDANYIEQMFQVLNNGVTSGANVDDLIEELEVFMLGNKEVLGALDRYTSQVSRDTLMQFSANYDELIAQELELEFYQYVGTTVKDTREFCMNFLGKFFHKNEVMELGIGKDPLTGSSLAAEGLLQGRIRGTNGSNIFINRGGWNCRHRFAAFNTQFVPVNVLQRNIDNGNWTPTKKQADFLGL